MSEIPFDHQQHSAGELASEYAFDYSTAKPNRFAQPAADRLGAVGAHRQLTVVVLDEDVAQVFLTPEAVNQALRALIPSHPSEVA
jgi:hypothetical protein